MGSPLGGHQQQRFFPLWLTNLRPWPRIPSSRPQMSSRSMRTARNAPASCLPCCLPASGPINGAAGAALLCQNPPAPHEISRLNKPGKDAFHRVPIRLLPIGRTRRTIFAPFLHRFCTIFGKHFRAAALRPGMTDGKTKVKPPVKFGKPGLQLLAPTIAQYHFNHPATVNKR